MARPTAYTPELLAKAKGYLATCGNRYDETTKTWDVKLPSIESLALYLGIARDTIHTWVKEEGKEEFSDIISEVMAAQANSLIQNGLGGVYNPTIAKLILTKHGYHDKVESDLKNDGGKFESVPMTPAILAATKAYEEALKKEMLD